MSALALCPIPPQPGPRMPIIRLKASQRLDLIICSNALWGIWTHWAGNRSEPCFAEKKACEGCKKGLPRRWKGYVHCVLIHERRQGFLELTPISAESLLAQVPDGSDLRGWQFEAKRLAGDKARMIMRRSNPDRSGLSLPNPVDPETTLMRLWGWEPRRHVIVDDWGESGSENFPSDPEGGPV